MRHANALLACVSSTMLSKCALQIEAVFELLIKPRCEKVPTAPSETMQRSTNHLCGLRVAAGSKGLAGSSTPFATPLHRPRSGRLSRFRRNAARTSLAGADLAMV
jgi:hypothetical protein